jgi:hypothetical protein
MWIDAYYSRCPRQRLWYDIRECLVDGLCCFLINPGPNVSIKRQNLRPFVRRYLGAPGITHWGIPRTGITPQLLATLGPPTQKRTLAVSYGSGTIFPTALMRLSLSPSMLRTFELVDGWLLANGRHHSELISDETTSPYEYPHRRTLYGSNEAITPSSRGTHASLQLTVRDSPELELSATIRYDGREIPIPLCEVIGAYYGKTFVATPCGHPQSTPLSKSYRSEAITCGIEAPKTIARRWLQGAYALGLCRWPGETALIMVAGNPVSQLLACTDPIPALVMRNCCLNCAVEQAKKYSIQMIIVT